MDCSGSDCPGILCPALKNDASPDFDPTKTWSPDNRPANQGIVSWHTCLKCKNNKGHDDVQFTHTM